MLTLFNLKKQKSLGVYVIPWIEQYLKNDNGDPFILTPEQLNFILHFYEVDEYGRYKYIRAIYRRSKGNGKSYLGAALSLYEFCNPITFDKWDKKGNPIPKPIIHKPMIWLCAGAESQTAFTYDPILTLIADAPVRQKYEIDDGLTRIYGKNGRKIVTMTANSRTKEGGRPTFSILDETHLWYKHIGGHKLYETVHRGLSKTDGRSIEMTNAHIPGEESQAERSYLIYKKQLEDKIPTKTLYDSVAAPDDTNVYNKDELRAALVELNKYSPWVSVDRYIDEIYNPNVPLSTARRYYLNQITAAEDSWIRADELGQCVDTNLKLNTNDKIILGFDGARKEDSTALIGLRVEDCAIFLLGLWEKPLGVRGHNWIIDANKVRDKVAYIFDTHNVVGFISDMKEWETDVDNWRDLYLERLDVKATTQHAIAWDMRGHHKDTTIYIESLNSAFLEQRIKYDGNDSITRHILNARRRINNYGVTFGKEHKESPKKVDILAAILLAFIGYKKYTDRTKVKERSGLVAVDWKI